MKTPALVSALFLAAAAFGCSGPFDTGTTTSRTTYQSAAHTPDAGTTTGSGTTTTNTGTTNTGTQGGAGGGGMDSEDGGGQGGMGGGQGGMGGGQGGTQGSQGGGQGGMGGGETEGGQGGMGGMGGGSTGGTGGTTTSGGGTGGTTGPQVGDACAATSECPAGGSGTVACVTDWPGGYCSVIACESHGHDCPNDPGLTTSVTVGAKCVLAPTEMCLDLCGSDADCRTGYGCVDKVDAAGHGNVKVCFPR